MTPSKVIEHDVSVSYEPDANRVEYYTQHRYRQQSYFDQLDRQKKHAKKNNNNETAVSQLESDRI